MAIQLPKQTKRALKLTFPYAADFFELLSSEILVKHENYRLISLYPKNNQNFKLKINPPLGWKLYPFMVLFRYGLTSSLKAESC